MSKFIQTLGATYGVIIFTLFCLTITLGLAWLLKLLIQAVF